MCGVEIVMRNGTAGDGERIREAQSECLGSIILTFRRLTSTIVVVPHC